MKFLSAGLMAAELIALADHPRVAGSGVAVTRYWQDGRVNYAAVPELHGMQLNRYRAPRTKQVRISFA